MSRTPLPRHRTQSSVMGDISSAGTPVLPNARHAAPRHASPQSFDTAHSPKRMYLLSDSNHFPVDNTAVPSGRPHSPSLRPRPHNGSRGVDLDHLEAVFAFEAQRSLTRRAVTAGASAGRSSAANGTCAADAIAFHYYSQQRRKRAQVPFASSFHDFEPTAAPGCHQSSMSCHDSFSAPATPSNRDAPVTASQLPRRSSNRFPVCRDDGATNEYLYHSHSALPSSTEDESIIRDTTTSLVPLASSPDEGSWPLHLSPSQHQQCEELVRLLAQLPATQAHRVLLAAIRQYEAQRLLQYYGGPQALSLSETTRRGTPPQPPSLASSPGKAPVDARQDDGRSALLETLRVRFQDMQRADLAAQALSPFTAVARQQQQQQQQRRRRRRQGHTSGGGGEWSANGQSHAMCRGEISSPTTPPQRPSRCGQLVRQETPQKGSVEPRSPPKAHRSVTGDARVPHQHRHQLLVGRALKPCNSSSAQGGWKSKGVPTLREKEASSRSRYTAPQLDFMQTIKPPHRHGLAKVLLGKSCAPREVEEVGHNASLRERSIASLDAYLVQDKVTGNVPQESNPHNLTSTQRCSYSSSSAPAPVAATTIPRETSTGAHRADIDPHLDVNVTLSPGANAARRVYWEQQQRNHERQVTTPLSKISEHEDKGDWRGLGFLSNFGSRSNTIHDENSVTCRYPQSTSTDCFATIPGQLNPVKHDTASLEDSVRRSEVLSFPHVSPITPGSPDADPRSDSAGALTTETSSHSAAVLLSPSPPPSSTGATLSQWMKASTVGANVSQKAGEGSYVTTTIFLTDMTSS